MREVLRGCVAVVWLILLTGLAFAQAEVKVFVGGAMTGPVRAAGAAFASTAAYALATLVSVIVYGHIARTTASAILIPRATDAVLLRTTLRRLGRRPPDGEDQSRG